MNSEMKSSDPFRDVPVYEELKGRVAVVTGAARGMGTCFAIGLARQGIRVVAVDIDQAALDQTVAEIKRDDPDVEKSGGEILSARCDVSSRADMFAAAQLAVQNFGQLDIWVNNAGVFPQSDVPSVSEQQIQQTFGVNVGGVFYGAQAAAAHMKHGGAIVNMASVAAFRVRPGRAVYSATKAAVHNLTQSLAVELGAQGIRVNALAPGFINTEMTNWVREVPGAMEKAMASIPLRRIGEPVDVFKALLFLVSDSAGYVSGQTLGVDGGSRHG